ncbi:aldo/keto reductase [Sulfurimonas sp. HSL-1716]|uniref:aldo/keto reductase n=1 Tax=Hydrocurvibacter sulfurireducens TaxID=3131937 RepID=UPI0031F9508F
MADFGFGTYRISEHNPQHIQALREAIAGGIKVIDTSTNYMDGEAERAIAKAMKLLSDEEINGVEIVSKAGYIQGSTLMRHNENRFEEVVEYSQNCYHSISQSFIKDQISQSLERLEIESIDCLLLHNPEYYILDGINRGVEKEERLEGMYRRLFDAFLALEEEIRTGRIKSYGISSNSFSKHHDDEEFLPYEDLLTLAADAARELRNKKHGFTTIELPINMLETEGLRCAAWAKENGLRVLANRPLNAQKEKRMFRLADYEEPREYYYHLNELLEMTDNEPLRAISNLISQLDQSKHKYGWIGEYDLFLYSQIVPHIKRSLQSVDEENRAVLIELIDLFLQEYGKMVAYECAKNTRIALKEEFKSCRTSLQHCAFRFLLDNENIDYVLVGARKPIYVADILSIRDELLKN